MGIKYKAVFQENGSIILLEDVSRYQLIFDTIDPRDILVETTSVEDYISVMFMKSPTDLEGLKEALVQNAILKEEDSIR